MTPEELLQSLIEPRRHFNPRAYEDSKITTARRAHPCQLCCTQIQAGEQQLVYAQGRRSRLYMHVTCARASNRYQCRALSILNGANNMKARTFANLVEILGDIIGEENEDRDGVVYASLAEDMAKAAALVYDSCLKGQSYAEKEIEKTTC